MPRCAHMRAALPLPKPCSTQAQRSSRLLSRALAPPPRASSYCGGAGRRSRRVLCTRAGSSMHVGMAGGYSEEGAVCAEARDAAAAVQSAAEAALGTRFAAWEVVRATQQVVAGMNYRLKVRVGDAATDFVHIHVFKPLPHTGGAPELKSATAGCTLDAPLLP